MCSMSEQYVSWLLAHAADTKYADACDDNVDGCSSGDSSWLEQQLLSPALWVFCCCCCLYDDEIVRRRCCWSLLRDDCIDFCIICLPRWSPPSQLLFRLMRPSSSSSSSSSSSCCMLRLMSRFSSCIEIVDDVDGELKASLLFPRWANDERFLRCLGRGGKCVFRIWWTK